MAEKLCELRKKGGGGGKYTETSLWTNPSPTSSFASQTITLSQSVDNFKYIAIKHKGGTSSTDTEKLIVSVEDLKKSVNDSSTTHAISFIGSQTSGAQYSRIVFYASTTSLTINTAYRVNRAESNDTYAIPLEILGLNELDHGTKITSNVEVFPLATVTGGTQPTYTTKGRAVAIWQMWGRTDNVGFGIRTNVNPTTGAINNNEIYMSQNAGISWTIQSGASFTVTDTTITTTTISSNNRLVALAYTY